MSLLPVRPLVRPVDLTLVFNGNLDATLLRPVGPSGFLHHLAARAWRALSAAALEDANLLLTYTFGGCYRTYAQQESLFRQRYTVAPQSGRPTKTWNGVTWYLLPGMATAATPGTSNHGLGLAVDAALGASPSVATGLTTRAIAWLVDHAGTYGFSAELQSEPWHWRYVAGDDVPRAVLDFERPPTPIPDDPEENDDMVKLIVYVKGDPSRAEALVCIDGAGTEMVGFSTVGDRNAFVGALGVTPMEVSAGQYDDLVLHALSRRS